MNHSIRAEILTAANHFAPGGNPTAGTAALEHIVRTYGAQAVTETVRHMRDLDQTARHLKALASILA